jgi:hypothetical protein
MAAACALLVPQRPKGKLSLKPVSALSPIRFREIAQQSGLNFVLHNNPTPRKHMIETMAGGLAAFDYNNDARLIFSLLTARLFQAWRRSRRSFSIGFTAMTAE